MFVCARACVREHKEEQARSLCMCVWHGTLQRTPTALGQAPPSCAVLQAAVRNTAAGLAAVVAAADAVIGAVDGGALAAFYGVKGGDDTPGELHRRCRKRVVRPETASMHLVDSVQAQGPFPRSEPFFLVQDF